ncbi:hypothetical protein [Kribbella sp. NPDC004875]|uniref:hypothetical protein n=1 Tax=Kribbella sp. NPDC004875 TaxID=3364107 RepID=UPI0036A47729
MTQFVIFVVVMIVVSLITKARQQSTRRDGKPNPRMQALIEKIQAQQGGNQPVQFQGQFTQAAGQGGPPAVPYQPAPYNYQPQYNPQYSQPQYSQPQYNQPPAHRPQQNNLPTPTPDLDAKVRELMNANNEVAAIRLLGEQRELGILEAQAYARGLMPSKAPQAGAPEQSDDAVESGEDDERYVGSAAFAESIFNLDDREENVWASGWVDTPEPDDRSDIDELWQTVSNPPRPGTTPPTSQ